MQRWCFGVLVLSGLALASGGASPAHAQADCPQIALARGGGLAEVSGMAPTDNVVCYALETAEGQTAEIEVVEGDNVVFSILGVADAQESLAFTTQDGAYAIYVGQLMRGETEEPFVLRVAVSDG